MSYINSGYADGSYGGQYASGYTSGSRVKESSYQNYTTTTSYAQPTTYTTTEYTYQQPVTYTTTSYGNASGVGYTSGYGGASGAYTSSYTPATYSTGGAHLTNQRVVA